MSKIFVLVALVATAVFATGVDCTGSTLVYNKKGVSREVSILCINNQGFFNIPYGVQAGSVLPYPVYNCDCVKNQQGGYDLKLYRDEDLQIEEDKN